MDERLPEDTLYWIMEEDYRFWPPGADPDGADDYDQAYTSLVVNRTTQPKAGMSLPPSQAGALPKAGMSLPPSQAEAPPKAGMSLPPSQAGAKAKGSGKGLRTSTEFHEVADRGSSREDDPNFGFTQDVCDMVRIATMCHREGWGDLIWASWNPSKSKPTRLGYGTQCLLATRFGFKAIWDAKQRGVLMRGHIDMKLKEWLRLPGESELARACYLYPPIGSYTEHASGCDPVRFGGDKTRPSGFTSGENPCHGTRQDSDPKHRGKYMYQWRGESWGARECKAFPKDQVLHAPGSMVWQSFEEPDDTETDVRWNSSIGDFECPGTTDRQKREFRSFRTRMSKRFWSDDRSKAFCVRSWGEKRIVVYSDLFFLHVQKY